MKNYKPNICIILFLLAIILNGCTESYPLLTNTYEEVLVVEATITNELKFQEIKLTKTAKFEDDSYLPESGAKVFITDGAGNQYNFTQNAENYISDVEFQAQPERKYQLHITTKDGRSFESSLETLTTVNPMHDVTPAIETKDNARGVGIRINSFDANRQSQYYRYEYEETYKIVAPKWVPTKATLINGSLIFTPNSTDTKICYSSKKSTDLILVNTNTLTEDRVNYLIRFISDQDYIITTRYSILVKQYVESLAAFTYYNTLKTISGSGSVLSPTQPGFLLGNLKSTNNPNNKIVGYFDVASVSVERIYFNYGDIFPNEPPPPYYTDCKEFCYANEPFNPDPCTHGDSYFDDLDAEKISYFNASRFYFWVNAPCGDCTTIASNIKPIFWTD
ncbi:DUF4249 domain-containing protein [Flavobacterium sp. N1736]|uniref:DUF4249 domain-containing protein n=1 Tax=Flavobacterium sp. N1736 TaxID=2986823 RepID=UPI002224E94A|nr:DUF4249 domain-containing protein [Flavobacterium sp. N1736]